MVNRFRLRAEPLRAVGALLLLLAILSCAEDKQSRAPQRAAYDAEAHHLYEQAVQECKRGRPESAASFTMLVARLSMTINSSPPFESNVYKADHYQTLATSFAEGSKPCAIFARKFALLSIRYSQNAIDLVPQSTLSKAAQSVLYSVLYKQMAVSAKIASLSPAIIALLELRGEQFARG